MFPNNPNAPIYKVSEIDALDIGFFIELLEADTPVVEKEYYLSDVW